MATSVNLDWTWNETKSKKKWNLCRGNSSLRRYPALSRDAYYYSSEHSIHIRRALCLNVAFVPYRVGTCTGVWVRGSFARSQWHLSHRRWRRLWFLVAMVTTSYTPASSSTFSTSWGGSTTTSSPHQSSNIASIPRCTLLCLTLPSSPPTLPLPIIIPSRFVSPFFLDVPVFSSTPWFPGKIRETKRGPGIECEGQKRRNTEKWPLLPSLSLLLLSLWLTVSRAVFSRRCWDTRKLRPRRGCSRCVWIDAAACYCHVANERCRCILSVPRSLLIPAVLLFLLFNVFTLPLASVPRSCRGYRFSTRVCHNGVGPSQTPVIARSTTGCMTNASFYSGRRTRSSKPYNERNVLSWNLNYAEFHFFVRSNVYLLLRIHQHPPFWITQFPSYNGIKVDARKREDEQRCSGCWSNQKRRMLPSIQ